MRLRRTAVTSSSSSSSLLPSAGQPASQLASREPPRSCRACVCARRLAKIVYCCLSPHCAISTHFHVCAKPNIGPRARLYRRPWSAAHIRPAASLCLAQLGQTLARPLAMAAGVYVRANSSARKSTKLARTAAPTRLAHWVSLDQNDRNQEERVIQIERLASGPAFSCGRRD